MSLPNLVDVKADLGDVASRVDDSVIEDVIDAEIAAQDSLCRVDPSAYPADLRAALLRRVRRSLAMRAIPLGIWGDAELGGVRVGRFDPEITRLEAPHRKVVIG